jgi:adenylylsulfate kinase
MNSVRDARRGDGAIVWLTGLSGAGKSTLAEAVERSIKDKRSIEVLDGDVMRAHLSQGLGYSREDRDTNVRRIGFVARLLARHGVLVVAAAISPYANVRNEIRHQAAVDGLPFIEVYLNASLDALIARDVKGLYKRALAGDIQHFTGVNDPYEPPPSPELEVHTDLETVEASTARILQLLVDRRIVRDAARAS